MSHPRTFAEVLKRYVRRSLYTPQQLSKHTDISKETIANWIDGIVRKPRAWWDLLKLATVLHLDEREATELLDAAGHPSITELRPRLRELLQRSPREKDKHLLSQWLESRGLHQPMPQIHPAATHPASLASAEHLLARLPTDAIPGWAPLPPGSRMLFIPNPLFVGRNSDLLALASAIKGGKTTAIGSMETVVAMGIGGIGKTQLACEFVHRYGQYFAGGVFWISFADPEAVADQVAALGGPAFLDLRPDWSSLRREDQVALVRAAWSSPLPRLLVFDNCEDEAVLQRWRPVSGGSQILVTSRRAEWEAALGIQTFAVDVLDRDSSIGLLRRYRDDEAMRGELAIIAEELGDLPLALHLCGSYLQRYRYEVSVVTYLAELRRPDLLSHPSLRGITLSPSDHLQHVARTFALSYDRLSPTDANDELALALLARAAWFAPGEPIPRELLQATVGLNADGPSEERLRVADAIKRLHALGLTQPGTAGAIRLHRLVVAFVRERLTDRAAQADVERALLAISAALAEVGDIASMVPLQQHLRAVTELSVGREDDRAGDLLAVLGHYLWLIADYEGAQVYLERCLVLRRRSASPDVLKLAGIYNLLGLLFQMRCEFDRSRQLFEDAIAIWKRELGVEHPNTITEHNNLGYLLVLMGDYEAADDHLRYVLTYNRQRYGLQNRRPARSIHNVGYLLLRQGHYVRARRYLKLALRIREQVFPVNHPSTALTLDLLGETHCLLGDYEAALCYHMQALAMRRVLHSDNHHDIAETLSNLGRVLRAQGDLEAAQAYLEQALEINIHLLGEDHRETAYVLMILGGLLRDRLAYAEAREMLERAIAAWERHLGDEHPELIMPLNELGCVLLAQGQGADAEALLGRALMISERKLDDRHPNRATTLFNIGHMRQQAGDLQGAEAVFADAEAIGTARLPGTHPLIRAIRRALAGLYPGFGSDRS